MSRFSQAEAEAAGWSIVHQRDEYEVVVGPGLVQKHPATIVAEKYISLPGQQGRLIHEEADSIGKLLERIHAYEKHLESTDAFGVNAQPVPLDLSTEPTQISPLRGEDAPDGVGDPAQSVVIPLEPGDLTLEAEVGTITDAEWTARSRGDVLVVKNDDGEIEQVTYAGGGEQVADAESLRLENKKAIEDRRAAEPAHGPTEQIEVDTSGTVDTPGIGAGGVLVVREGEGPGDVVGRKEELKKMREEGRVASMNAQGEAFAPAGADKLAGVDVGIQERGDLGSETPGAGAIERVLEEPENEQEENVAPHIYPEGAPAELDPPEEPASAVEHDARVEAEEAEAKEQRDEGLADAESDEANAEVREAGIEAADEAQEEFAEEAKDADADEDDEPEQPLDVPNDEDEPEASTEVEDGFTEKDDVEATDAAKAKAKELGVDLDKVKGSGKEGRVTAPDVEAAAEQQSE